MPWGPIARLLMSHIPALAEMRHTTCHTPTPPKDVPGAYGPGTSPGWVLCDVYAAMSVISPLLRSSATTVVRSLSL